MSALRIKYDLPNKEIAFKDFRMGPLRRMLPAYLRLVDQFVSGLVFTLVVEKNIPSLFGPGLETRQKLITTLEEEGYGPATPKVAEKLFRITHIVAFLVALLGHQGQKIFWMTDHDAIGATPAKHTRLLSILTKVLPLYTSKSFSFLGGAQPFESRALEYLDLLSLADVSGGSIAEILTNIDDVGHEKAHIKEGGQHVLRWLCHDSVTLKKFSMIVRHDANRVVGYGTVNFAARTPIPDEIFIPTQLVR